VQQVVEKHKYYYIINNKNAVVINSEKIAIKDDILHLEHTILAIAQAIVIRTKIGSGLDMVPVIR